MKKPLVLALFLWGTLQAAEEPGSSDRFWDVAARIFRKRHVAPQESTVRRMRIESNGRRNLFTVSFDRKEKPIKDKGGKPRIDPAASSVMEDDTKAQEYLAALEKELQAGERDVEVGREARASEGLERVVTRLEAVSFTSDALKARRLKLLERAMSILARIETRREFRKKGCQVQFIIFNASDRLRSVASIDGEIVREGGACGGGVRVQAIAKSRVTVVYKGETFDLSLVKAQ